MKEELYWSWLGYEDYKDMKIAELSAYLMDGRCFVIMTVSMRNEKRFLRALTMERQFRKLIEVLKRVSVKSYCFW